MILIAIITSATHPPAAMVPPISSTVAATAFAAAAIFLSVLNRDSFTKTTVGVPKMSFGAGLIVISGKELYYRGGVAALGAGL